MVRIETVRSWVVVVVAVASAACDVSRDEQVQQVCSAFCSCTEAPLPALQDRCVAKCTDDADVGSLSDDCIACITANSDRCSTLQLTCAPVCQPPTPVDDGGNGL